MSIALNTRVNELERLIKDLHEQYKTNEAATESVIQALQHEIIDLNNKYKMLRVSSAKTK